MTHGGPPRLRAAVPTEVVRDFGERTTHGHATELCDGGGAVRAAAAGSEARQRDARSRAAEPRAPQVAVRDGLCGRRRAQRRWRRYQRRSCVVNSASAVARHVVGTGRAGARRCRAHTRVSNGAGWRPDGDPGSRGRCDGACARLRRVLSRHVACSRRCHVHPAPPQICVSNACTLLRHHTTAVGAAGDCWPARAPPPHDTGGLGRAPWCLCWRSTRWQAWCSKRKCSSCFW